MKTRVANLEEAMALLTMEVRRTRFWVIAGIVISIAVKVILR